MINNPQTFNIAQNSNFQMKLLRAPAVSYFCQEFGLPGVSMKSANVPTPFLRVPYVGDHMEYDPLIISFKVDADYQNWLEIFNWMRGITSPSGDASVYAKLASNPEYLGYGIYSNIEVIQLDENKNPFMQFVFEGCAPIELSTIKQVANPSTVTYLTATATFRYIKYDPQLIN